MGLMSGTSLDGVDVVLCEFANSNGQWEYRLIGGKTVHYTDSWKELLARSYTMKAAELVELDHNYGKYLGAICQDFLSENGGDPSFIASHGHTVFHRPDLGYSLQIGNGHDLAAVTEKPVIYDFRSRDISLGGQGAPLVPAGDRLLFGDFESCLNIGGFTNISYNNADGERIAFDICPANTVLNHLSSRLGQGYDHNGASGRKGKIIPGLLSALNDLPFYLLPPPKSTGREFLEKDIMPLLAARDENPEDLLRTFYEHIITQVNRVLGGREAGRILVTGGGARNTYLMELLRKQNAHEIVIPGEALIDFKEAIVFAFLGLLRMLGENNCLSSVTGASSDNSGGIIIWPGREN